MGLKGRIIVIIISLILYFIFTLIYQNLILKDDFSYAYVINQPVKKGESLDETKLSKITYSSDIVISDFELSENNENYVYKKDCDIGEIISNDILTSEEKFDLENENKERIVIKINQLENNLCGNLKIGDRVNIYASARTSDITDIINVENVESFSSNSASGTSTLKLIENIEILKCYDSEGYVCKDGTNIENIMIEVDKETAIKVNNLKNYATFSLSLCM